jgi:di/tricarboxylate transporter
MDWQILFVFGTVLLALILFISEWLAIDTVSILIMVIFMAGGILTPEEGFKGFTNPATITIGAMLVISAAIFKTGALGPVRELLKFAGKRGYFFLLMTLMAATSVMSATINNTAVVALLIPVILEVSRQQDMPASRLLMPLSFAGIMGGVCTLIGTSTNLLVSGIAEDRELEPIGMFELTLPGLCFLAVGLGYMMALGRRLLPRREEGRSLEEIYDMGHFITKVRIPAGSIMIGNRLEDTPLIKDHHFEILQLEKASGRTYASSGDIPLEEGDTLTVRAKAAVLRHIATLEGFRIITHKKMNIRQDMQRRRVFEALLTPDSPFIGRRLKEAPLSRISGAASVLGIRSRRKMINEGLDSVELHSGDILLVQAEPGEMRKFHESEDLLVITELEEQEQQGDWGRTGLALTVLAGVILASSMGLAPVVVSAAIGALCLILFRIISPQEAYEAINWKVIFMLAGVLSMGAALEKTGADGLIAHAVTHILGQYGPDFVLSGFFLVTLLSSNIMSNNASAALMAPIAISVAMDLGVSPRPFLMAVTFAASLSFMLPMGYQTNIMIYTPGNYSVRDYLRLGAPLTLLFWLMASLIIPLFFPF